MPGQRAFLAFLLLAVTACTAGGAGQSTAGGSSPTQAEAESGEPLVLTSTPETDAAAEGTVTLVEGGTISATASDGSTFELVVPPGAVAEDTVITMTPLRDVAGLETTTPIYAVELEPDGQQFHELVRLTITPATPIPLAEQVAFEAAGDGTDPGPVLVDPASEPIVALLEHFTEVGATGMTDAQKALFLRKSAENSDKRLHRELSDRIGEERQRQLLGEGDVDDPEYQKFLDDAEKSLDEHDREVVDKLREAAMLSCEGLKAYVTAVIGNERARTFLTTGRHDESKTMARVAQAVSAMTARYQQCEKEAIKACNDAKKASILVDFWLAMGRQFGLVVNDPAALLKRAQEICEPKALQFEMSGSGTFNDGGYPVQVTWEFWGLKCEDRDDWLIWENVVTDSLGSTRTRAPGDDPYGPVIATFGDDGVVSGASWPGAGNADPLSQAPEGWGTLTGTTFTLVPAEKPADVHALIRIGSFTDSAPVEPADGSIPGCNPTASPAAP